MYPNLICLIQPAGIDDDRIPARRQLAVGDPEAVVASICDAAEREDYSDQAEYQDFHAIVECWKFNTRPRIRTSS